MTYERYIPSFVEAEEICSDNPEVFYKISRVVNGFGVDIFNYRLPQATDFDVPGAMEMRGLTFVIAPDGVKRYLMLDKFFNLNQTHHTQSADLDEVRMASIATKLDGSMIRFIPLPDGSVVAKTKLGFDNDQALMAQKIYDENREFKFFVDTTIHCGCAAIFELISPFNQIVIDYDVTNLICIQIRDEKTGAYMDFSEPWMNAWPEITFAVSTPAPDVTITELYESMRNETHTEGIVVVMESGQMVKLKTDWYCERHRLMTDELHKENFIIQMVLQEKLDDLISIIDANSPTRKYVECVAMWLRGYVNDRFNEIQETMFVNQNRTRKDFAIDHNGQEYFSVMMALFDNWDPERCRDFIADHIMKKTNKLEKARSWLDERHFGCKETRERFMVFEEEE